MRTSVANRRRWEVKYHLIVVRRIEKTAYSRLSQTYSAYLFYYLSNLPSLWTFFILDYKSVSYFDSCLQNLKRYLPGRSRHTRNYTHFLCLLLVLYYFTMSIDQTSISMCVSVYASGQTARIELLVEHTRDTDCVRFELLAMERLGSNWRNQSMQIGSFDK